MAWTKSPFIQDERSSISFVMYEVEKGNIPWVPLWYFFRVSFAEPLEDKTRMLLIPHAAFFYVYFSLNAQDIKKCFCCDSSAWCSDITRGNEALSYSRLSEVNESGDSDLLIRGRF
jgi:hypothetical protein